MDVTVGSDQERRSAEQWFRRRGLPAVVRGRPGQIVVRTLPAVVGLTLAYLMVDVLEAIDGDGEFETRVDNLGFFLLYSAVLAGSVVLPAAGAWLAARRTRRWVPRRAGFLPAILVTAGFVAAEPVFADVIQNKRVDPLGMLDNFVPVGTLLLLTAAGVGSVFCWALRAALRQLRSIGLMTTRSLPLLLLITTFGFFTAEIWQSVGTLPASRIWLVVGFFGAVGALFLFPVLSAELQAVTTLSESAPDAGPPLTRLERANMVLMLLLTQALQAVVFGVVVFALFVTLGWLAVPHKAMSAWVAHAVAEGSVFGVRIPFPGELLHVCLLIAAFSALYFIVTVVTDAAHRSTFYEPVLDHLKVSLAERAGYLNRLPASSCG